MAQDIVARVKGLLTKPAAEWDVIDREPVSPQPLVTGYVAPLAAIPAIAGMIGIVLIGYGGYKVPFGPALMSAVLAIVMAICGVFLFAFIINALAPNFGAQKNFNQALKVAAFAPTATWVAGIFSIIPMLSFVSLIGAIYSLYLIFVGLPKLMKPPAEKATTYTVVSILVAILASLVIGGVMMAMTPRAEATSHGTALVFERQASSDS